jgi:hypothetical protein
VVVLVVVTSAAGRLRSVGRVAAVAMTRHLTAIMSVNMGGHPSVANVCVLLIRWKKVRVLAIAYTRPRAQGNIVVLHQGIYIGGTIAAI